MQILRYAIFDMDGTLLDSTGMWDTVGEKVLARWGKHFTPAERRDTLTMTIEGTAAYFVRQYALPATPQQVAASIRAGAMQGYATEAVLKPGVPELLAAMQRCGVKMCVASGTEKPIVDAALAHFDIARYFDFTLACNDALGKESPDVYLRALAQFGLSDPAQVMVFEDSPTAVRTAKAAGFYTVGVQDKFTAPDWPAVCRTADATVQEWPLLTAKLDEKN